MKPKLTINGLGDKIWKLPSGDLHRENGPAVEFNNGFKGWYLNGINYTKNGYKVEMMSRKLKQLL